MGPDIYDRMHAQLKAAGLEPLEAETWLELIFQIADIAKTDPDDIKGPILQTVATGKMDYAALNSMQEKGVQLTGILSSLTGRGFPEVVTGGHVSSFLLKIALKQYVANHKTGEIDNADPLSEKFEAFFKNNNETSWPTDVSGVDEQSKRAHAEMIYTKADNVNHPKHYTGFSNGTEVIDITENLTFNTGNAVKYLARAGRTDGNTKGAVLEDLEKARWYVQREIERLEKDNNEAD